MEIKVANRLRGLQQSHIRAMTRACDAVKGINLGQGLGDLSAPRVIVEEAIQAIRDDVSRYTPSEGLLELRQAISRKLARDNDIDADPHSSIVVTSGATGAFAATVQALLNPGDGILLPEPYYGYHLNTLLVSGVEPQFVPLRAPAFRLEESLLRAAIKPNTRAVLLCTPGNPSGNVATDAELALLAKVAAEHDLLVITDEIYEYITYDGHRHRSPANVPELRERTISLSGFSKSFSITGWRLGYAVASPALAQAINLANDLYYVCAPAPLQRGVALALDSPEHELFTLKDKYQWRRDVICEGLARAGLRPLVPQGAYYVLADISDFGYENSVQAATALLEQTGVAAIPGEAFFASKTGDRYLRFCFAKDEVSLREAAVRIQRFRPRQ